MSNYSLQQAQIDIANTRYQIAALSNSITGLFANPVISTSLTLPDGSTWTVTGPTLHAPLSLANGGTGVAAANNAALLTAIGAQPAGSYAPTASPTFTGTITFPDGSTVNATQVNLATLLAAADQGSNPATPGSGAIIYSSNGQIRFKSSDGNVYRTGKLFASNTSSTTIGSSATNIAGCNASVLAKTYRIRATVIFATGTGTAGGSATFGWTGPATSLAWMTGLFSNGGYGHQTASLNGAALGSIAASTTYNVTLDGYVTFTSSGTLNLVGSFSGTLTLTASLAVMEIEPVY